MKRTIILASLALFAAGPLMAQKAASAKPATEQTARNKRLLASKIDELSAYASRNATDAAKQTAEELLSLMQEHINATRSQMSNTTQNSEKLTLRKKYNTQVNIMTSVKNKLSESNSNLQSLVSSFKEFQKTL